MTQPPADLHGILPRRLYRRHIAAALHEPDERVRWLMRSEQLPTYAEAGRWRWTTAEDLVSYAAQHQLPVDWHALAAAELGIDAEDDEM